MSSSVMSRTRRFHRTGPHPTGRWPFDTNRGEMVTRLSLNVPPGSMISKWVSQRSTFAGAPVAQAWVMVVGRRASALSVTRGGAGTAVLLTASFQFRYSS